MKNNRGLVLRLAGEAILIVASVYTAIVLEGMSTEREQRASALESLRYVRAELLADQDTAREYARQKRERAVHFSKLSGWLTSGEPIPADSFGVAMDGILRDNLTAFPRRAAWTTMLSQAQLEFVDDPGLVNQLADLYDRWADRVVYNGALYDEALMTVTRTSIPSVWDRRRNRFRRSDPDARLELDGQLLHLENWNESYRYLMDIWADRIQEAVESLDRYLASADGTP